MRCIIFLCLCLLGFGTSLQAQIRIGGGTLDKIKDKTGIDVEKEGKNLFAKQIEKARQKYDSTNFRLAIAMSDNSGFYEESALWRDVGADKIAANLLKEEVVSEDPLSEGKNKNETGELALSSRKFDKAERLFGEARLSFERKNATRNLYYPRVISNEGYMSLMMGRFEEAEQKMNRAMGIQKEVLGAENTEYATSLNNKAILCNQQSRYFEAEQLIEQAIAITEKEGAKNEALLAIMYNNKAFFQQTVGRYKEAEASYQKCLEIAKKAFSEKKPNYQKFLMNFALLYQDMGRYEEAEKIYQECIRIKEKGVGKKHPDYAHLLDLTASLYMEMGKLDKVEQYLTTAIDINKKSFGEEHPAYVSTLNHLGRFYRIQGNYAKAEPLLKRALDIRGKIYGTEHPKYVEAEEDLAIYFWQTQKTKEAVQLYREVIRKNNDFILKFFPPMSEAEKERYWSKLRPSYLRFYAFASEFHTQEPALLGDLYNYHLATKGILLSATNKIKAKILSSGDEQLISLYNQWIGKKELLALLYTMSKDEIKELNYDVAAIEKEANQAERELSAKSELFKQGFEEKAVGFKEVQQALKDDEAAVEIISFYKFDKTLTKEARYIALVATKQQAQPQIAFFEEGDKLNSDNFNIYRNLVRARKEDKFSYKAYWEPVAALLANRKKVYLSLDGVYNQINVATLRHPEGKYLIEMQDFVLLTNSKDIPALKAKEKAPRKNQVKNATLIGFPNYGSSGKVGALPGTKKEVEDIKKMLGTAGYKVNLWMGDDASESKFKTLDNGKNTILHIATHGFFLSDTKGAQGRVFGVDAAKAQENPLLRAGLMLAGADEAFIEKEKEKNPNKADNGILTAFEIMNLNLNTELLVASACETAVGDVKGGEGVYGLQRAFQVAGADVIVMSLWKVSDEATQELMNSFYKALLSSGNKATAFRQAQLALKNKFKEPYYWGAFVMVGY